MKKPPEGGFGISWWPEAELNRQQKDSQSSAPYRYLPLADARAL